MFSILVCWFHEVALAVLASPYSTVLLAECLGDVAILVVPHGGTVAGVNACTAGQIELTEGAAYLVAYTGVGDSIVITTGKELGDFVLVVTYVGLEGPAHVASLDDVYIDVGFKSLVDHRTYVTHTSRETSGERVRNVHNHIGTLVLVEVDVDTQTVKDAGIDTEVELAHLLPGQHIVGSLCDTESGLAVVERTLAKETEVRVGTRTCVTTGSTIVETQ